MLAHRIYYTFKPIIPLRLRLAMRRLRARRISKKCGTIWPIYEPVEDRPKDGPAGPVESSSLLSSRTMSRVSAV